MKSNYFIFKLHRLHTIYAAYFLAITLLSTLTTYAIASTFVRPNTSQVLSATTQSTSEPTFIPAAEPVDDPQINLLLLGHGDPGHDGGNLTDSITVVHFDTDQQIMAFISIPRDLWVTFSNNTSKKINAAYTLDPDSASIAKATVSSITNLPIDHFIAVNFFGLTAIVDELDGIDITLQNDVYDAFYPVRGREQLPCDFSPEEITELSSTLSGFELEKQFTCRYETLDYPAGDHHITGAEALKISRSRHGSSDFQRSQRQQAVLEGIKEKLLSLNALQNAPDIYQQLSHTFTSDIDIDLIKSLAASLIHVKDYRVVHINLDTTNVLTQGRSSAGAFILTPKTNLSDIHQYIQTQINTTTN